MHRLASRPMSATLAVPSEAEVGMAQKTWELSGEYMESCNCDYLCPCIFTNPQAPATHEHCTALMVYRIDHGRHGDISLDGLKFALVIRSGPVMSDGGWVFGCVVDEKASEAQRRALAGIVGGTADGPPVNRSTTSSASAPLDLLRGQRVAIVAALACLVVLSWLYLFDEARQMAAMDQDMVMPPKVAGDLALLLAMWWIMMVGMMLPSAAPMILTFAAINRGRRARRQPYTPTVLFASGYLVAWGGFSVAATLAQWALEQASLLSPMAMKITSPLLGGLLFVAAGLYQVTPLKSACLSSCRSPFDFVVNHWRDGA